MRRRSSSRCSRNPIAGISSWSDPCGETSAAISGIRRRLRHRVVFGGESRRGVFRGRVDHTASRHCATKSVRGRQNLGWRLPLQVGDLRLDLGTKFIGSALEFVHGLADLAGNLGQLLWPEYEQSQHEKKNHFREAEIHAAIILPESDW